MAETYRIKPLEWNGGHCSTVFGSYTVQRRWTDEEEGNEPEGPWYWSYCFDEYYDEGSEDCESFEDGKQKAEAHYREHLLKALEPVKGKRRGK